MTDVYCSWVETVVDEAKVSKKYCKPHFKKNEDGTYTCDNCGRSPQLDVGTPVDKLLEQLQTSG
jgi:transcription elongation factor Elf1